MHSTEEPSAWVGRFSRLIPSGGTVLDLACGSGRHAKLLAARGLRVLAVDRDAAALAGLAGYPDIEPRCVDLEAEPWPLGGTEFTGIVVTNYLHRPLLPQLAMALADGGVLIYETFMRGNEAFGSPRNPDFLLQPNELLQVFLPRLAIVAFEQGEVGSPRPAVKQRLCARRGTAPYTAVPLA
jgi:SAM-dependent methyltransferase